MFDSLDHRFTKFLLESNAAPIRVAREREDLLDSRPELTEKLAKGDTWR